MAAWGERDRQIEGRRKGGRKDVHFEDNETL
jgi:hypothetical protein